MCSLTRSIRQHQVLFLFLTTIMLSKADEQQLQRVCANQETLFAARRLVPLAKARTKQGSGHYLAELATGLPAICAYLVSKQRVFPGIRKHLLLMV